MFHHTSTRRIKREAKIGDPVIIPESLIQKLKPYGPHFIKVSKAILGDTKSGKNAVEKAWQEHPYEADELQEWVKAGNNYGVIASWHLGLIDADTKELQEILEAAKISTFTVKTGRISGEGRHLYFDTDASENGIIFDKDGKQIGNIQIRNKYVVGPGCHHNSGGVYRVINDVQFARISKEDLENIFGKQLKWTGQIREKDTEEAEEEKTLTGKQVTLTTLMDITNLRQRGDELQGSHPVHGSTTGTNFCVNTRENVWHCFRCNSGGGWLSWIAVKHGLLQCHEAQKGALRGVKFIEALKIAKEKYDIDIQVPDEDISPDVARFFEETEDGKQRFVPALVVKELTEEAKYITRIDDQTIFKYNPNTGTYEEIFDIAIGKLIAKKLGKHWISNRENEIIGFLKRRTVEDCLPGLEDGLIAVKNGVLNIYTRELKPFSPELFVINALPVTYDPKADCPKYKTFLSEIVPPELDRESIQQFFGYTLTPNCRFQKALMLVGIGANGKSTLLTTWLTLLGHKNVSSIPLQTIQTHKFALARLYGKMANIYPDLPAVALKETDVFKTLVSGEMVEGEEKFKPLFSFTNIAKLIFSCNQVPPTPDNSVAFFRRWIIIMFPNQFLESNPKTNPNLIRELTTPEELSGILNWALEGLAALEKQSKFTVSKTTEDVRIQYAFLSDPVKAFADTKLEPSFEDEYLEKTEVYETYLKFCETFKLPTISKKAFAEELPQHSTATAAATTVGGREGERVRIWRGIKFKVAEDSEE